MPLRLAGLIRANAHWGSLHPRDGELPNCFTMDFRSVSGPGNLDDGRLLRATLTPAELAEALGAIPALTFTDDDDLRALMRVIRLLKPEHKEGT